jgi:uncharacterized glyoxalase superfamily protein PhnB
MEKIKLSQPVPQLPVEDVEKAQVYYKEMLGFEISWTYPDKSMGAVARGGTAIFFARANGPIEPNIHWIFSENIDLAYAEFMNRGVDIIEPIENKPWNLRQFAIRDLNGHIFYIHHDL